MPIHDWSRIDRAVFHSFYLTWVSTISVELNNSILPSTHYAMCETHRDGQGSGFVELPEPDAPWHDPGLSGKLCYLDEVPPRVSFRDVATYPEYAEKVVTIRRSDYHKVVAAIRIVAAETKRSRYRLDKFVGWTVEVLRDGISVLLIDLFPPGPHNPDGIHKAIWDQFMDNNFVLPTVKQLTLASYLALPSPEAYVEPTALHSSLAEMPVFLSSNSYVPLPLESSYQSAINSFPSWWRDWPNNPLEPNPDIDED